MRKHALVCRPMNTCRTRTAAVCFVIFLTASLAAPQLAAATGRFLQHNTPSYVRSAKNLGAEDPSSVIDVSIWLKLHNRGQLDSLAAQLYDRNSPNYRHFLTRAQFVAQFAPSAAEAKTVEDFFQSHNLKTVRVGPDNMFVRARGSVADVENAFHVQLNRYQFGAKVVRANASDPYIEGDAADLVSSVSGLDNGAYEHPLIQRGANLAASGSTLRATPPASDFFTSDCFGTEKESFSTDGNGSFPIGAYSGNHLLIESLTSYGCGYTPAEIYTAYNLTGLYKAGYNGAGQTIAIIDWCGSLTIQNDANAFNKRFGLPPLTSSNFQIIDVPEPPTCASEDDAEINIDVEWAHAIAPGANINLILADSANFQDVNEAEYTAINYGLGNVLSGSYGSPEPAVPPSELANESLISEIAAASGISANFATGDEGDWTVFGLPATVEAPADSPWSTAVGGVTLALNSDLSIAWQAGWGNDEITLADEGTIFNPPQVDGFHAGAGGGPSNCVTQDSAGDCIAGFPKPSFQKKLPGSARQTPDVSWLADPFTGAVIAISIPGQIPSLTWQVYGGTSVATPMFSALWAIANQVAGAPLGQAAPYLYSMPSGAIFDVVPVTSKTNVVASIKESKTKTVNYDPSQVLGGATPVDFVSAVWDVAADQDTAIAVSFGTDCETIANPFVTPCTSPTALHTAKGWDNVTGVGTPNGEAFVNAFAPSPKQ